jgi:hypothetical protein
LFNFVCVNGSILVHPLNSRKHQIAFIFILSCISSCLAQLPETTLSPRNVTRVEKAKSASDKLRLYRKLFSKDSLKQVKEIARSYTRYTDSISRTQSKNLKFDNVTFTFQNHRLPLLLEAAKAPAFLKALYGTLNDYHQNQALDSLRPAMANFLLQQYPVEMPDSGQIQSWAVSTKAGSQLQQYKQGINNFESDQSALGASTLKQLKYAKGDRVNALQSELESIKNAQNSFSVPGGDQYQSVADSLQDSTWVKEQAQKKAEEAYRSYLAQHPELTDGIQKKMDLLMKKYSIVPNSNDLSTAVKRSSLEGKPFSKRLVWGGNFQVISLDPVSIDVAPEVGYLINSRFVVGVGALYRQTFGDSLPRLAPQAAGLKIFSSYDLISNFFVHAEYARSTPSAMGISERGERNKWQQAAFLGMGKRFTVHPKYFMNVLLMYNFIRSNNDTLYSSPWVIRFGFQQRKIM